MTAGTERAEAHECRDETCPNAFGSSALGSPLRFPADGGTSLENAFPTAVALARVKRGRSADRAERLQMGKELFKSGMKCAEIAQIIGYAAETIQGSAKKWGWERLSAHCRCGAFVPLGKRPNMAQSRECRPCMLERQRANKAKLTPEQRKAYRERAAAREGRSYVSLPERRALKEKREKAAEDARRILPAVQVGRFRHYGEQPTTREGALAVMKATLSKLLDVRCAEAGVYRDTVEYNVRYKSDDAFRASQKAKAVINRSRREKLPSDGTLTSMATQALFASAKCCAYCDKPISGKDKTLDHMHPVSLGGFHSIHNAVICCYSCNSKKHALPFDRWLTRIPPHIAARFCITERAA